MGRQEGLVWFVPYAAPGDLVRVRETGGKKTFRRGSIVDLIEASPERVEPRCPWFGDCGGCQWQHIEYQAQLTAKHQIVTRMAEHTLQTANESVPAPVFAAPQASPREYEYRRRITLHADTGTVGYYAGGSRRVVPVRDCPVAVPAIREHLASADFGLPRGAAPAKRFELRADEPENDEAEKDANVEILNNPASASFLQVNPFANELLLIYLQKTILDRIAEPRIFDLFCGDGNLSLPLAPMAGSILGWDSSRVAIGKANERAKEFPRVHYHAAPVEKVFSALQREAPRTDLLILDPPRQGLRRGAAELAHMSIPLVVYVSCDPSTLMRDLAVFMRQGYRPAELKVFDLFPQTYHVETVAILTK